MYTINNLIYEKEQQNKNVFGDYLYIEIVCFHGSYSNYFYR